jgi:hypothetical protein
LSRRVRGSRPFLGTVSMSDPQPAKGAPEPSLQLQLLDMLDRLRDGINLQIELTMRDIRRMIKEAE